MLLKPLILGVSIDFGLLSIALTLRFIIYPLLEKTIEIRIEEIDGSNHYKQYLKI